MPSYQKVKQGKISDIIAEQLESNILQGVLVPGEKLPSERDLAKQMNVSRPSLREAIQKLENQNLLETKQGGGTYVRNLLAPSLTDPLARLLQNSEDAAQDFLEFRMSVDARTAYYAAIRATDADRELLKACFTAMEEAHETDDPTEEAEIDADFHLIIAEAAHNVVLLHIMRALFDLFKNGVFYNRNQLYVRPGARDTLLKQHRAIYEGVMNADPEAASAATIAHLKYVQEACRDMGREDMREEVSRRRLSRYLEKKGI